MSNIIFSLPQPLIYVAVGGAVTYTVMKYGMGRIVDSIYALMDHPLFMGAIAISGLFMLSSISSPVFYTALGCITTAVVMKHGIGNTVQSIRNFLTHPLGAGATGIVVGGIAGFYVGIRATLILYQKDPQWFHTAATQSS
jgi:hypothetical protein